MRFLTRGQLPILQSHRNEDTGHVINIRQWFAHPLFCQQINRSRSLPANHTPPQQSFSTRVLRERTGNVEDYYHIDEILSNDVPQTAELKAVKYNNSNSL